MTKKTKLETFLPAFGGFYGTPWEDLLSDAQKTYAELHTESEREQGGLEVEDFVEIFSEVSSVSRLCGNIARSFCEGFDEEMSNDLGFRLGLKFSELESPSEYNFTTNRIVATMPLRSAKKLFELSMSERHERLIETIADRFTPHPGFMPCYSEDIGDWIAKPVAEWDRNELCVLLDAFVGTDIDEDLYSAIAEGGACGEFESSVDWKRFEKKVAARRREKTEEFLEGLVFDGEPS